MVGAMLQAMLKNEAMALRIRAALDRTGKPRKDIAEALGVSPQALNGWQTTGRIAKENLAALAALAGMSIEELLRGQAVSIAISPALTRGTPVGPAAQASDSVRLDPARLESSVRFLEQQFALWGREFVAAERTPLIAQVYDYLSTDAPSNLVSLSQWLANKLSEEDSNVGEREAGGAVGGDRKRSTRGT